MVSANILAHMLVCHAIWGLVVTAHPGLRQNDLRSSELQRNKYHGRNGGCSFTITSTGPVSGRAGQLDDGQIRVNGSYGVSQFSISEGRIVDATGKGCILTPAPITQFQCDNGKPPIGGFSIDSASGALQYSGSSVFYACPATDTEYNLYTDPNFGQLKCVQVGLQASACLDGASSTPSPAADPSTVFITYVQTETFISTVTCFDTLTKTDVSVVTSPVWISFCPSNNFTTRRSSFSSSLTTGIYTNSSGNLSSSTFTSSQFPTGGGSVVTGTTTDSAGNSSTFTSSQFPSGSGSIITGTTTDSAGNPSTFTSTQFPSGSESIITGTTTDSAGNPSTFTSTRSPSDGGSVITGTTTDSVGNPSTFTSTRSPSGDESVITGTTTDSAGNPSTFTSTQFPSDSGSVITGTTTDSAGNPSTFTSTRSPSDGGSVITGTTTDSNGNPTTFTSTESTSGSETVITGTTTDSDGNPSTFTSTRSPSNGGSVITGTTTDSNGIPTTFTSTESTSGSESVITGTTTDSNGDPSTFTSTQTSESENVITGTTTDSNGNPATFTETVIPITDSNGHTTGTSTISPGMTAGDPTASITVVTVSGTETTLTQTTIPGYPTMTGTTTISTTLTETDSSHHTTIIVGGFIIGPRGIIWHGPTIPWGIVIGPAAVCLLLPDHCTGSDDDSTSSTSTSTSSSSTESAAPAAVVTVEVWGTPNTDLAVEASIASGMNSVLSSLYGAWPPIATTTSTMTTTPTTPITTTAPLTGEALVLVEATRLPNLLNKREVQYWLAIDVTWPTESPDACTPVAFQSMEATGDSNFDLPASWAFGSAIGTHTSCVWTATTTFAGLPPTATATLTCPDQSQPLACLPIGEDPLPGCIRAVLDHYPGNLLTPLNKCQFP